MAASTATFEFDTQTPSTSSAVLSHSNNNDVPFLLENDSIDDENATENEAHDEYWTPAELLKEFTQMYLDEMNSPKLLPEKFELVDKLLSQKTEMEAAMALRDGTSGTNNSRNTLIYSIHKMELCRVEFLVNSYLRIRLKKIEQNPSKALHQHSERMRIAFAAFRIGRPLERQVELLDRREIRFAENLVKANSSLFADSFLKHLPACFQLVPILWGNSADRTEVFIEVLKDGLEQISVPNMAEPNSQVLIQLEKGTRHMVPFNCIEELVERGDVRLL